MRYIGLQFFSWFCGKSLPLWVRVITALQWDEDIWSFSNAELNEAVMTFSRWDQNTLRNSTVIPSLPGAAPIVSHLFQAVKYFAIRKDPLTTISLLLWYAKNASVFHELIYFFSDMFTPLTFFLYNSAKWLIWTKRMSFWSETDCPLAFILFLFLVQFIILAFALDFSILRLVS